MKIEETKEVPDPTDKINPVTDPEQVVKKEEPEPKKIVETVDIKANMASYRDFLKQPINMHPEKEVPKIMEEEKQDEHDHHHDHDHHHHEYEQEDSLTTDILQTNDY